MKVEVIMMKKCLNINEELIKKCLRTGISLTLIMSATACTVKEKKESQTQEPAVTEEPQESQTQEPTVTEEPQVQDQGITEPSPDSKSEEAVVQYFEQVQEKIAGISEVNASDIKDWAFDRLVDTVDFVNNKKPIGGIYFNEMTGTAKGVVVGTLDFMDESLMKIYPDYKEKASEVFGVAKDKLGELKDSVEKSIGEQIGEERYNEIKDNVKNGVNDLWEKTKEKGNQIKDNFESWYEEQKAKRR